MNFNTKTKNIILYDKETISNNSNVIKNDETLNKVHEKKYNPKFLQEMNEIKKEKPIRISSYNDLFDDE